MYNSETHPPNTECGDGLSGVTVESCCPNHARSTLLELYTAIWPFWLAPNVGFVPGTYPGLPGVPVSGVVPPPTRRIEPTYTFLARMVSRIIWFAGLVGSVAQAS